MNWKKILTYLFAGLLLALVVLGFLANRDLNKMYGGHTTVVAPSRFELSSEPLTITNVNVLAPTGDHFLPNQTVYIVDGIIQSIDSVKVKQAAKTIDGSGQYLIPGLIDAHVHLFKSQNDLLLYVANGVTFIRELIGSKEHLDWRTQIESGRLGPGMYITSPRIGSFGTIEGFFMEWTQWFKNISTPAAATDYVEELAAQGYDGVKVYSQLNKDSYQAINQAATAAGLDVVGHIPWSCELTDIWASNQSDIAHLEEVMNALRRTFGHIEGEEGAARFLSYIDEESKAMLPYLLAQDISVTTTLWLVESFARQKFELDQVLKEVALAYENPGISEWVDYLPTMGLGWLPGVNRYQMPTEELSAEDIQQQKIFWTTYTEACQLILRNFAAGGVKILAGTDANLPPTVPGFSLHDELASMQAAGMTPAQVLQSATAIPAARLGTPAGKIQPTYRADLVLLDQNPLEDIRHTRSIQTVILGGKVLNRELLDELLQAVRTANDESRTKAITKYQ